MLSCFLSRLSLISSLILQSKSPSVSFQGYMDSAETSSEAMPSNIIYVGVPGFTAFTLVNLGQTALTVLENNNFLSGLSQGTPPDGVLVGQIAVVFAIMFSLMLIGMACTSP